MEPASEKIEKVDNNLTISTKLSTDQLICKTPQDSPNPSIGSVHNNNLNNNAKLAKEELLNSSDSDRDKKDDKWRGILYLAFLQIVFGLLMVVFGVLVILQEASLAQIGGGIWGGSIACITGVIGLVASARDRCPLKDAAQRIAHTAFLAMSLVSLAVANLVLVLAATGLARDSNQAEIIEVDGVEGTATTTGNVNVTSLMCNIGLLLVSGVECLCAAIAAYQSSRIICPCFRTREQNMQTQLPPDTRELVSSWLGKHSPVPPLYIVTSTGKKSKMAPMPPMPPMFVPPPSAIVGYPLIPAPLGPVPSPRVYHMHHREMVQPQHHHGRDRYRHKERPVHTPTPKPKKSHKKPKEHTITTEEVAKTYTGLDRTIAEEFIEICDSRNTSISCGESSCQCSGCNGCPSCRTGSEVTSADYRVEKI